MKTYNIISNDKQIYHTFLCLALCRNAGKMLLRCTYPDNQYFNMSVFSISIENTSQGSHYTCGNFAHWYSLFIVNLNEMGKEAATK